MADEPDTSEPNDGGDDSKLELPKLGFRRRKKQPKGALPVAETAPEPAPEPTPEPVAETPVEAEVPPPAPEPEPEPEPEPVAESPVADEPEDEPEPEDDHTQVLPSAPELADEPGHHDDHDPDHDPDHDQDHDRDHDREPAPPRKPKPARVRKQRKPLTLPPVAPVLAAALTGVVVGLGIVALTFLSSRGCQAVRGTGNCGPIGLLFLVAILVLAVLAGGVLLRAWRIGDPLNSSFLAVGLVAVIAMLFFLNYIDQWWMVIAIPAVSLLTYVLSWWVTRTFVNDPADDDADEPVDVDSVGL